MKLHLGCGKKDFGRGWVHIDGGDFPHLDSHDITKLDYENVDLIYACHVLEYFDREEVIEVLKEWCRVLRKDGILRISVPDFPALMRVYNESPDKLDHILGPLFGRIKMGNIIYHKTVYDFRCLEWVLIEAGFGWVQHYDWQKTEHSHVEDFSSLYYPYKDKTGILISLNVEAVK